MKKLLCGGELLFPLSAVDITCSGEPDAAEVENMKNEVEQLRAQVEELTKRAEAAEAKLAASQPAEAEPSAPEGNSSLIHKDTKALLGKEAKPDEKAEEKKE